MKEQEYTVIGKKLFRNDGKEKVCGSAKYINDLFFADMVYVSIATANVASGIVKSIDIEEAKKVNGVIDVLTFQDIPGKNQMGEPIADYPILLKPGDEIRYVGDYIAIIAAVSPEQAYLGSEKVRIEVEPREAVLSLQQSIQDYQLPGKPPPIVHHQVRKGDSDAETMFKNCDFVFEGDFFADYQEHAYMETQGMIALYDQDNTMTVYGSMQCPYYVQNGVAHALNFPIHQVRIIQTVTGGGFGGKEEVPTFFAIPAALVAYKLKKPAKIVLTREQDIQWTSKRHPIKSKYKVGVTDYGRIRSVQVEAHADVGGHSTLSPIVLWRASVHAAGAYEIPNVKVDVYGHYTHKVPCGAFRGFGSPQVFLGIEGMIDEIALRLKMDALYIRKINALEKGKETATGHLLTESVGAKKTIEEAEKISQWETLKQRVRQFNETSEYKKRGIGVAHIHYGVALGAMGQHLDASGAFVQIAPDGSIGIHIGGTEIGQGAKTTMAAIASEVLGQKIEKIKVYQTDTFFMPDSGPTVASRTTIFSGNAVLQACKQLREKLDRILSDFEDKKPITFDEISALAMKKNIGLSATGWFQTPRLTWDSRVGFGEAYVTYSFATQIVVVEVDCLTAEVAVNEVYTSHDVGKALNPDGIIGQIQGGFVQGMGYALYESVKVDSKGRIVTDNFNTLTIPTIHEVPRVFEISVVEIPFSKGPFGAKGIGEPSLIPTPAAIANAVSNAIGKRITQVPIRKEALLELLKEQEKK